ncbi:LacI family DNA-binding transcriptional regulator [Altererythrobacter xixiisoli]|uniref:LacI family DNA-binding transcriptional regulator n=1 Tax=Croceibacterium xixiisoli TaxID=1476466 RepID=A0A6I4TXC4_9SPHN|nr:LacI family DNA-binding transcriptional regulator [Croceibacterium xixiisoli]MXO99288.1 LacI family DNA-binding transcriptional regulator [Croceibacterium xixiisoli]
MQAVTLDDVAVLAAVSAKTVSRVVNGDARVSPDTRQRVQAAIASLGYRPNLAARSLATSRSGLIGMFAPLIGGSHFFGELMREAIRACRQHGYHLAIEEAGVHSMRNVDAYREGLRKLRCEGMVLPAPVCDDLELLDALDADGVRYVRISPALEVARSVAIVADHAAGARAVAQHLWSIGRRRFGLVTGMPHQASSPLRRDGFLAGLAEQGITADQMAIVAMPDLIRDTGWGAAGGGVPNIIDLGRHAGAQLFDRDCRPDAIFTYNDELAAGVVSQARDRGIDVPGQLSVVGFDDSDAARLCWPPLTTVRQPIARIAAQAVDILITGDPQDQRTILCPVELVVRGSSAAV